MGIGISVLVLAAGAVLQFAIESDRSGFDVNTIGTILMVVGAVGLVVAMIAAFGMGHTESRETIVHER
jgi:hypothetical protein